MDDERAARLEQGLEELQAEWVALEHVMTAAILELHHADASAIKRIHRLLMAFAIVERKRGGDTAERRAIAVEVLADRLLLAARRDPGNRAPDATP